MSQSELAKRARTSRKWIIEFEAGKQRAEFGLVMRLLEQLALDLEVVPRRTSRKAHAVDLDELLSNNIRKRA
jgi:hypothetical protein